MRLPNLFRQTNVSIIAWALLHDVHLDVFDAHLNSVGLLKNDGQKKRGFNSFKALKSVHPTVGYSHAAKAGKTLYIAGQVAQDVEGISL